MSSTNFYSIDHLSVPFMNFSVLFSVTKYRNNRKQFPSTSISSFIAAKAILVSYSGDKERACTVGDRPPVEPFPRSGPPALLKSQFYWNTTGKQKAI